jgi:hypothetical protein
MKHLVVRPTKSGLCAVSILDEDKVIDTPFESWALDNGKGLIFAHNRLPAMLKQFYVGGQFQDKALYTYSYDEMVLIAKSGLGPSDRERYEAVKSFVPEKPSKRPSLQGEERTIVALQVLLEVCGLFFHVMYGIGKVVLTILLVPFIIKLVSKPK